MAAGIDIDSDAYGRVDDLAGKVTAVAGGQEPGDGTDVIAHAAGIIATARRAIQGDDPDRSAAHFAVHSAVHRVAQHPPSNPLLRWGFGARPASDLTLPT